MTTFSTALALLLGSTCALAAGDHTIHTFAKKQLDIHFWAEGANFGDFNRDGHNDIVAGPYWYEGPDYQTRHEYYPALQTFERETNGKIEKVPGFEGALGSKNAYSDNFFAFTYDFNADTWTDILIMGFPGKETTWYENPRGGSGHWQRHDVFAVTENESPTFEDITGDGKPEIICNSNGYFGYAEADWNNPARPWTFRPISPKGSWQRFTHGLGVGDVNGDGRKDVLDKDGWWEQPSNLPADKPWQRHQFPFSAAGGAQMFAYDVDGDGDNDVITSLAAHGYGLAWYEHIKADGEIRFKPHVFMNKEPHENKYGVQFSQLHALDLVDMDGDDLKDIVTGKRFWAHGPTGDAEPTAPAVLYWFKLVRHEDKTVDFVPYLIDDDSGVGTQVVAGKINKDDLPDVVVGNKKGVFVLIHQKKNVSKAEWEKAQPKPIESAKPSASKDGRPGLVPVGEDGQPLNLGFESGTLNHWVAEGKAFDRQPIRGDTVFPRRNDMKSGHVGQYWIGTYEIGGDALKGTLTSVPFTVSQPFASFLVAGGPWPETRVELVRADNNQVIFKISGYEGETLRPVAVDLRAHSGKQIFIRIVDDRGGHWGHINFDDFRFHQKKPKLANALDPAALPRQDIPPADVVPFAGISAEEAARVITAPPGFTMKAFASEPDVHQPIAFAIDHRGRIWVAEAYNYPFRAPEGEGKDRILIFEDTDGDGRADKRTVFIEKLNLVSGLEVGFGGVWVGAAPYLMFIADRNEDDKPDGDPEILLDGWAWQDTHETLNTFAWGPDGWLYGCHGVFTHSNVGKPGADDSKRTKINAGVWRYHPIRQQFEVFGEGTSNPWGIDFNEYGQCFIEACVIPHLFHVVQGGRYQRQAGQHFNRYVFDDIKTIADHVHYAGDRGPHAGNNRSDAAGGGHAHAGLMVYLGDSWPDQYRGAIFMNNIHGQRINQDVAERSGSGYIGRHAPDFLNFNDRWSQALNLLYDQNGSVYIIDWYDANQCHHHNAEGHDRSNGRIYKLVYNDQKWTPVNLAKMSDAELVQLQLHKNDWHVRHARRILQARAHAKELAPETHDALKDILENHTDPTRQLRALWALHVTGGLSEELAITQLQNKNEFLRAWAVQLLAEGKNPSDRALKAFEAMAKSDESPLVRLYIASALQRTPVEKRWPILENLVAHGEDANDPNLPLLYWYAAEPAVASSTTRAVALMAKSKIPKIRQFITRRMAAGDRVASN